LEANAARAIAIYLPQFHPIPENDEWWGKGFTEWTNVTKARPLFPGHLQPDLPSELGFYDLRVPEVRDAQAALAREHGISGFCYYHYWFDGKVLLGRPVDELLALGRPEFPFMLCWANESWTRTWLGRGREILIEQRYSPEGYAAHARYLGKFFRDQRYIRIDGRPAFAVYRPTAIPDAARMVDIFRSVCRETTGEDLYLIASNSHAPREAEKLLGYGFDAILNFTPQLGALKAALKERVSARRFLKNVVQHRAVNAKTKIFTYPEAAQAMRSIEPPDLAKTLPCVFVGWDNTPRRGKAAVVITGNDPALFEQELRRAKTRVESTPSHPGIVFINAWNEWAEGNHLEPGRSGGRGHLEAVKRVFPLA
jgi:hypothetical protein